MVKANRPAAKARRFKGDRELRKFGLVMFVPVGLIGGLLFWRQGPAPSACSVLGAAAFFLAAGLVCPKLLGPIEWAWMKLAGLLSYVMTRVILTIAFFAVITPIGLMLRLFGKDSLQLEKKPEAESYWVPVEEDGPGTRSDTPF